MHVNVLATRCSLFGKIALAMVLKCMFEVASCFIAISLGSGFQAPHEAYVESIRAALPARHGMEVQSAFFNEESKVGRWKLENASDGSRMRWLRYTEMSGTHQGNVFCTEFLVSDKRLIQSSITGTCAGQDYTGFTPDEGIISWTSLALGGITDFGGWLGNSSLAFGYIPERDGLVSVHSIAFSDSSRFELVEGQACLVHEPSQTKFFFDEQRMLCKIERPTVVYRDGEWVDATAVLTPETFNSKSEVIAFRVQTADSDSTSHLLEFHIQALQDDQLNSFAVAPVKNGDVVGILNDRIAKPLIFIDGEATYPVDPRAKLEIEKVLTKATGKETESDSSSTLWPYLRATSSADCGLYSFAIAAAGLGIEVDLESIISTPEYSSKNGSSAKQLERLAVANGFAPTVFQFGNFENLASLNTPVIVHCGSSYQVEGVSHWAAILEVDTNNRRVLWADLPASPRWIDEAELLTAWDGIGLALRPDRIGTLSELKMRFGPLALPGICLLVLAVGLKILSRQPIFYQKTWSPGILLIGLSLALGLGWLQFSKVSFLSSPVAVALTKGKVAHGLSPESDEILMRNTWEDWHDNPRVEIFDARIPQDYAYSHVASAINLPPDCSLVELKEAWQQAERAETCVVYCQNETCAYSHLIARKLNAMGHQNIIIYSPGFSQLPSNVPTEK